MAPGAARWPEEISAPSKAGPVGEDAALVAFTGRNGEARFVRVDGVWYLSLGATASSPEGAGGTTGTTGGEGG